MLISCRLDKRFAVAHFNRAELQTERHFNGFGQVEIAEKFIQVHAARVGILFPLHINFASP